MLRQLFAPGDHNRHRAAGGHFFKALVHVVGFDELRPHLGGNAAGQREIASVARHLLADARHRQRRHAVARARVHQLDDVIDRLMLKFAADIHLRRHRADVQAQRVLHRHRHAFVRQLAQNRVTARGAQHHRFVRGGWHLASQDTAGAHQHVGFAKQRRDGEIDTLKAGGRPLKVAVVKGQHHRAVALRVKDACQAGLHAPVQRAAALQGVRHILLRRADAKILAVFDVV
ncbi:hypothetical protein L1887_44111 [Cichorium endivia]|nr:hypothetical protein L1887_44111 [Cichorium endivia]